MSGKPRIFLTGTMRTGGSLLINLLSMHSNIIILNSRVHFFRFIYKKYEPLNPKNVERMLHHLHLRIKYRYYFDINIEQLFSVTMESGFTYSSIYAAIMQHFLDISKKEILGEYAALNWREIPIFLNLFPEGKAIHIIRDPRGVLSSWGKLSSLPDRGYLNAIFNWIDSVNYMEKYIDSLPANRYLPIRFEDIHNDPEKMAVKLCKFIGVPFEEQLLQPDKWSTTLGTDLVKIPKSAHEGENIVGFSKKRTLNWQNHLEDWEISLAELLTNDKLEKHGYKPFKNAYQVSALRRGLDALRENPFHLRQLTVFLATGEGTNQYPTDPVNPQNWGAPENQREWFTNSPAAENYFKDLNAAEKMIEKKYREE